MTPLAEAIGLITIVIAVATFLGGMGLGLVKIGGFVHRMESASKHIQGIEDRLDKIPQIEQAIEFVVTRLDKLEGRHDSTRAHALIAEDRTSRGDIG